MVKSVGQRQLEQEICMAEIKKDITFIKEEITENRTAHQIILKRIDDFIEAAPDKFANKQTEEKVKKLEEGINNIHIKIATIAGGAIVIFYIIQIIFRHYGI